MLTSKVAKRYAKGFLDFTEERGETAVIFKEMQDLIKILQESKDLKRFFQSPIIDYKKKLKVAEDIFKSFSLSSFNLIKMVIKHGREAKLSDIAQVYIDKVEDIQKIQRVSLTSVVALSQDNINSILQQSNLVNTDSKFDLKTIIKPEILGGYILRVGDQQIDASVKMKLNQIKKEFQLN